MSADSEDLRLEVADGVREVARLKEELSKISNTLARISVQLSHIVGITTQLVVKT